MILMSLFDKDLALKQAGGNPDLAKELFEMLLKDLPISQQSMNIANSTQDKEAFWNATHKIHGGTAYCGVPDLKTACKSLEDEIKKAYPSESTNKALDNLNNEITLLLEAAEEIITTL